MDTLTKTDLLNTVVRCLAPATEIQKIVVFGSFMESDSPEDLDIAVFQDTDEPYLPLAMKYRRMARPVSSAIPLDILPIRPNASGLMLNEIAKGKVIYER